MCSKLVLFSVAEKQGPHGTTYVTLESLPQTGGAVPGYHKASGPYAEDSPPYGGQYREDISYYPAKEEGAVVYMRADPNLGKPYQEPLLTSHYEGQAQQQVMWTMPTNKLIVM